MKVELHIGEGEAHEGVVHAELYDNPVAGQVAALLPAEFTFEDYGGQEKLARLGRPMALQQTETD